MSQDVLDTIIQIDQDGEDRDAYDSINGYLYQFELTLLHILEDGSDNDAFGEPHKNNPGIFKLETIEDYVKYYKENNIDHIRSAQIKHHNTTAGESKYYKAILWMYCGYLRFLQESNQNVTYQTILFHFDKSPDNKDILNTLNKALESERNKEKDKQYSAYKEIIKTQLDSIHNREEFSDNAKYVKTKSLNEVSETIKQKLKIRYQKYRAEYSNGEFLYAAAVSKLIRDGREKYPISLKDIDDYFKNNKININKDFYQIKIIEEIYYIIEQQKEEVATPRDLSFIVNSNECVQVNDKIIDSYDGILENIRVFLTEKFKLPENRRSFLNTVVTKKLNEYTPDSHTEYQVFLNCFDETKAFIAKLAKIIYFYQAQFDEVADLNSWFDIRNNVWFFCFPYEQRGNGAIMGDIPPSANAAYIISELITRLSKFEIKPHVWYLGDVNIRASQKIDYKPSITKIDNESSPCNPSDGHFYIQCLNCLSVTDYEKIEQVSNIFTKGCDEDT
ncbi:hypothetical protein ACE1TI_16340 [Alteribacillus sp. JSM 102045]|uniref:hypothetical protein n=1 Tax=Alteribacillus sp. JSM 102045 TaxID=1562101 RepID=UPI0035C040E5